MSRAPHHEFTFLDYLRVEEDSGLKHEFLDGDIYAMSGGSPDHAAIATTIGRLLGNQLAGRPCRVFSADLRIRVRATGLGTYPDGSVVCGRLELDPEDPKGHTVTNPVLLIEVLSPSTETYDRGKKLEHYRQIASLSEVLLVAYDRRELTVWRRGDDGWSAHPAGPGETATLASIGCALAVDDVYHDPLGGDGAG